MKNFSSIFSVALLVSFLSFSMPIMAQQDIADSEETNSRLEKMERDLMLLQRQVARAPNNAAHSSGGNGAASADFEVRLSAIEDQMRGLVGKTEENDFKAKKLAESLDKLQRDTDFRFNEITKTQTAAAPLAQPVSKETGDKNNQKNDKNTAIKDKAGKTATKAADIADGADKNSDAASADSDTEFATPRDHYNYAFRQLNQTQYDKSTASFEDFTKSYPKDPLIGNAYYWLGETFYIRRDYVSAADSFRQGFEALPAGPKAPDNLLKLAMSLNALKRDKEACVVLGQIIIKFKKTATAVTQKAEQERKRIACE
jgi:tol-pal system protein YbgF